VAWEEGQHSIKLMGSNEMEYHTTSKISLRPKVLVNDCMVREPLSYYTRLGAYLRPNVLLLFRSVIFKRFTCRCKTVCRHGRRVRAMSV